MLHIVNKSPFDKNSLESCLRLAQSGCAILLIEDGVYGAMRGTRLENTMKKASENFKVHVLGADLEARGMSKEKVISGINVVDYGGFVDLVAANNAVQSWL